MCVLFAVSASFGDTGRDANTIKTLDGRLISFSEMDDFLLSQMEFFGLPGLSIVVINDAGIAYHRVLGVADVATQEKVTETTLFDAGSLSKTPFAYLVMKLAERGVLDLDRPLHTYLPYPDIAHDDRYKLITARMVLSHTSGFPNWRFFNEDKKLDIKFTPGTRFLYSGEGFEYLASVVAHLKSIKKNGLQFVFEDEVAKPLGMRYFFYTWNDYVAEHRAAGHVNGKAARGYGISAENPNFYAAYSLQTEARSYARFLLAMIQKQGLKKTTFDEMLKIHVETPSEGDPGSWCLGVKARPSKSGLEFTHTGDNHNFTSAFLFNIEQRFGYVFFTNGNRGFDFNKELETFLK